MRTDPKVLRLITLVAGTALLAGLPACGSSSQPTGSATAPAAAVKKEAGILSVNLRVINQAEGFAPVQITICGGGTCKPKQELAAGQVADMSASSVKGTIYGAGQGPIDFTAVNPPVGAPSIGLFDQSTTNLRNAPYDLVVGLEEGQTVIWPFPAYTNGPSDFVITRDPDTSDYKMFRIELRGRRSPTSDLPSLVSDAKTVAEQAEDAKFTENWLKEQYAKQAEEAKRLAEAQALMAQVGAAQEAADQAKSDAESALVSSIVLNADLLQVLSGAGVLTALGPNPTPGTFTTAQVEAARKALVDKQQALVDAVKEDVKGMALPSDDAKTQAARDDFDEAAAAAQAQIDEARAQVAELQAQLKQQAP